MGQDLGFPGPQVPKADPIGNRSIGDLEYRGEILDLVSGKGLPIDIYSTSFYLGRETMSATGSAPMAQWRKKLFIFMSRNAWNATSFFKLPPDRVIELGNQVEL